MADKKEPNSEKFSAQETQRRFEAALRGARITGHKEKRDIAPKRSTSKPKKPSTTTKDAR